MGAPAAMQAMVRGFNTSVGGNSQQVNSYWKGQGRGSMPQILSFEEEMIYDNFGKLIDVVA